MNVQPPTYFTSGSPNTCGSLVDPITSTPGDGSWPPSTKCSPPSSEYMNPEIDRGFRLKPRKSLKAMTTCCPVASTAIEVSDCVDVGPSGNSRSSPSHSG